MTTLWTTRRPQLRKYTEWNGSNLAECEAEWPTWTFSVNVNGTLRALSENGEFNDPGMAVGTWFTYDAAYESDPTLGSEVQVAPGPGLVSFTVTADE